jgi:hypothetical protein
MQDAACADQSMAFDKQAMIKVVMFRLSYIMR